ncbi:MAG: winged helix-turn-helix transcriptional regulator, partial [Lentilitoribacter sp.]
MTAFAEPHILPLAELSEMLSISERAVRKQINQGGYYKGTFKKTGSGRTERIQFDILKLYRFCVDQLETLDIYFNPEDCTIHGKNEAEISTETLSNEHQRYLTLLISIAKKYGDSITEGGRKSWAGEAKSRDIVDEMLKLRSAGASMREIAKQVGKSASTVNRTLKEVDKIGYAAYKTKSQRRIHKRGRKEAELHQDVTEFIIKELAITDNVSDICYRTKKTFKERFQLTDYRIRKACKELTASVNGDIRNLQAHQFKRAKNYNRTFLPMDYSQLAPNDWWFMDFHIVNNAEVIDEDTGEIGRVRTCGIEDARTRRLVGWNNVLGTPSGWDVAQMVIATIYKWGMPGAIIVDAGSENWQTVRGLDQFERGLADAGVRMDKVHFQNKTSKNGLKRYGGHFTTESEMPRQNIIERFWQTMDGRFSKRLKGQDLSGKGRTPKGTQNYSMVEFENLFMEFLNTYHTEMKHSNVGRTPWAEYEKALDQGFNPVMPSEADRKTYEMHFGYRYERTRASGFGGLLIDVPNPEGGKLYFDIQDLDDPTIKKLYVSPAPDFTQAAIYDENHNFLFVAPKASAEAGSEDTQSLDQYQSRLHRQNENMKPV